MITLLLLLVDPPCTKSELPQEGKIAVLPATAITVLDESSGSFLLIPMEELELAIDSLLNSAIVAVEPESIRSRRRL